MALVQEMESQGLVMFNQRGWLPVFAIVGGLAVYAHTKLTHTGITIISEFTYELICLGVALLGAFVRAYTVGYTPYDTSGRNISGQIAATVNTTGMYSIVRHPLYVGNFFCSLGIAMLTQNLWFTMFFIMLYWVYYERIMMAEEKFLSQKFGEQYTSWASRTPAFVPNPSLWKPAVTPFSLRKVIRGEKNVFFYIFLMIFLFSLLGEWIDNGTVTLRNPFWASAFAVWVFIFLILKILKTYTEVLTDPFARKKNKEAQASAFKPTS